ncbi:DUF2007 domain-containing protein [Stappia sp. 28M-7]|uniref:putative signal transducing protein n=1 Tax=Stappia sp. 28M-7 TaxID=2762596 RepID=UPI000E7221BF|nr:DUF2007 domain-containing protein [Stappia sp. 28M-7]MBC2860228.1 DUF2007 domain-containing protein [Stappia sp. 28M-7]
MVPLLKTNDMVLISYVEALLDEAGIGHLVLDGNMSILEGSLGIIPRRVMVIEEDLGAAIRLMRRMELAHELDADTLARHQKADGSPQP